VRPHHIQAVTLPAPPIHGRLHLHPQNPPLALRSHALHPYIVTSRVPIRLRHSQSLPRRPRHKTKLRPLPAFLALRDPHSRILSHSSPLIRQKDSQKKSAAKRPRHVSSKLPVWSGRPRPLPLIQSSQKNPSPEARRFKKNAVILSRRFSPSEGSERAARRRRGTITRV
jgi:hypothetical protein